MFRALLTAPPFQRVPHYAPPPRLCPHSAHSRGIRGARQGRQRKKHGAPLPNEGSVEQPLHAPGMAGAERPPTSTHPPQHLPAAPLTGDARSRPVCLSDSARLGARLLGQVPRACALPVAPHEVLERDGGRLARAHGHALLHRHAQQVHQLPRRVLELRARAPRNGSAGVYAAVRRAPARARTHAPNSCRRHRELEVRAGPRTAQTGVPAAARRAPARARTRSFRRRPCHWRVRPSRHRAASTSACRLSDKQRAQRALQPSLQQPTEWPALGSHTFTPHTTYAQRTAPAPPALQALCHAPLVPYPGYRNGCACALYPSTGYRRPAWLLLACSSSG